jgi:hypothetical protein
MILRFINSILCVAVAMMLPGGAAYALIVLYVGDSDCEHHRIVVALLA